MVFAITRDVAHVGDMGKLCMCFHLKGLGKALLSNERYTCTQTFLQFSATIPILHKSRLK